MAEGDVGVADDVEDDASADVEANRCPRACALSGCTRAVARFMVNGILMQRTRLQEDISGSLYG